MSGAPAIGSSVLHYTIIRAIGSGGMGVVYEAEDTKLGRRVALKFLPPELARDRPALERFQREARAASALNHPNICTIYAIEEWHGEFFIAMELLDGESLDRRIAERPIAWDALVEITIQVADALDAAHHRGIIHRDIKPANVFLTRDGRAKVLDFGVAKIAAARAGDAETMAVTPPDNHLTGPGMAVGTIAYMSPEQARGDDIDARSDLFSLAAVLYEMATARPAFGGKTIAIIFQKILSETPSAPRNLNPTVPPKLEEIIVKGLEKDRDLRYQTAAELRGDLRRLKRDAGAGTLSFTPPAPEKVELLLSSGSILAAEARRRKGLVSAVAAGLLVLAIAASYGIYSMVAGQRPPAPAEAPGKKMNVSRLTNSGDVRGCGSISADGNYVVYCDLSGRLYIRQVATGSTVFLGNVVGATTFSPDGNFVYLSTDDADYPNGVLWMIPTLPGERRRVVTNIAGAVGVSPDGRRIAFLRHNSSTGEVALMTADALGGNERPLATSSTANTVFDDRGVSWSHDGKLISASQSTIVGGLRSRPVVVDAASGAISTLGTATWPEMGRTVWLPGNALLFTALERAEAAFQFWIVPYPGGSATRITDELGGFGNYSVSVTADGSTIATIPWDIISNLWSTTADGSAAPERWTSGIRVDGEAGIAPASSGRVYYGSHDGADLGVWSVDSAGGRPRKLTRQDASGPSTGSDGRFVVFEAQHEGRARLWRMESDGSEARVITHGDHDIRPIVSPDSRWIYYVTLDGIMRMPADGGTAIRVGPRQTYLLDISPDGRRLLGDVPSEPAAKGGPAVLDAESGAVLARLDVAGAFMQWGRTAEVIAFIRHEDGVSNVWEQPIAGGPARQLTKFTTGRIFNFAYCPDGKRLFLARGTRTGDVVLIRNFR